MPLVWGSDDEDDDYAPSYRSIGPAGRTFDFGTRLPYASCPRLQFGACSSTFSSPAVSRASSEGDATIKTAMAELLASKSPAAARQLGVASPAPADAAACRARPQSPRPALQSWQGAECACDGTLAWLGASQGRAAQQPETSAKISPGGGEAAAAAMREEEPEPEDTLTELISMVRQVQVEKATLERHCRQTAQGLEDVNQQNLTLASEVQSPELSLELEAAGGKRSRAGELSESVEVSELPVRKQPSQPEAFDLEIDQLTESMLIDTLKRERAARDAYSKQIEANTGLLARLMQKHKELRKQRLQADQKGEGAGAQQRRCCCST